MSTFDAILLAVDQSGPSDRAVEVARDLATLSRGTVHLLHIREIEVIVGKAGGTFELETDEDVETLLQKEISVLRDGNVKMSVDVRRAHESEAARTIIEVADEVGAGIVVMGSRGQSALAALVLGSTAYKVLHTAHRPVLIVP